MFKSLNFWKPIQDQSFTIKVRVGRFSCQDRLAAIDLLSIRLHLVGATLENTEKPKCHSDEHCQAIIASLAPQERPLDLEGGHADPKCR